MQTHGQPVPGTLLETDLIHTFVTISETGSFSSAAKRVLRTPSAVSMQMKRLEDQLGRPLFVRQGRSVALTPDGEALLAYGRQMLRLNKEALSRFLMPALEGRIRFGAPDDFGSRFLPNILSRFAVTHPQVEVDVILGPTLDLRRQFDDGKIDLMLATTNASDSGVQPGRVIHAEPLVWVGLKGGCAKTMDPLPLALAGRGCCWRDSALNALDLAGRRYRVAYTCENCNGQLAALMADLAVAPLPVSLMTPAYERLGPDDGLPDVGHYQIRLCENADIGPVGKAFGAHVVESFAELA